MLLLALLSLACVSDAVPLTRRMVDMSYTFDDTILHLPIVNKFQLDVVYNGTELNGIWMLGEDYSASVHLGTHMDAPAHFDPNGTAVDKIPIRHFVAPAAVIDITAKAELDPDCGATVEDLLHWERLTGQSLNQTIVLLKSGWGQKWNNMTAYIGSTEADINKMHFPGFSEESARWLVENRNIYGIGSETISFDRGAANTFPAHQIFLGHGIFGLENVANLDKIPIYGAKLYVMPMKIGKGSGAPTRVIAVFPNVIFSNSSSEM